MSATVALACPTCGQSRIVRRRDVGRAKQCRRCHLSQIAPLGYAATKERHSEHFVTYLLRQHRLSHPSCLEQIVQAWLDEQGIYYEREYWLEQPDKVYLVDFILPRGVAVEVNGDYVHRFHAQRDQRKIEALRFHGFTVVVLTEDDVKSGAFARRLEEVLQ